MLRWVLLRSDIATVTRERVLDVKKDLLHPVGQAGRSPGQHPPQGLVSWDNESKSVVKVFK